MSDEGEVNPGPSKKLVARKEHENGNRMVPNLEAKEAHILDQIIIAPEIMSMILENLDIRSLKQTRLVCKSWLQEAQVHMKRRGIVRFYEYRDFKRIKSFLEMCQKKIPDLPQPFQSIDVKSYVFQPPTHELLCSQLKDLCPPLLLTSLHPWEMPWKLFLQLIVQCSSSLEHLQVAVARPLEEESLPPMDPKQAFLKLRHLNVNIQFDLETETARTNFVSMVAWIVRASPNLEVYRCQNPNYLEVEGASELLLKVDVGNVKTLILCFNQVNIEASEHFLNIPFSRLENLRVSFYVGPEFRWSREALVATMMKSRNTLRILDLSGVPDEASHDLVPFNFPVCPNMRELTLGIFPTSKNFLANIFPSLQTLNVGEVVASEELWRNLTPLLGLKTLRIRNSIEVISEELEQGTVEEPIEFRFFKHFPSLERLCLQPSLLNRCCVLKAAEDHKSAKLFHQVKHLELLGKRSFPLGTPNDVDYSSLGILKGLETITMRSFNTAVTTTSLPLKDLPCLKVFAFPWAVDVGLKVEELLEIAGGVKKVVVTNYCCSILREESQQSAKLLEEFFESASNAECGCSDWKSLPALGF